jgi:hypothetical protein
MSQGSAHFVFILTFGNKITEPTKDLPTLTLTQEERITVTDQNRESYYLTLNGVKVNKKIYQPCHIEAELDFTQETKSATGTKTTTSPPYKEVAGLLRQRQVKVELLKVDDGSTLEQSRETNKTFTVAENCYVYELDPQLKRDANGTKMFVKLNIFSMDKLMTLNKYSKAYVARKLGSGILKPESLTFGTTSDGVPLIKSNPYHLQFLSFLDTNTIKKDGKDQTTSIPTEFIQPYLVQYNESFYDFLVRTANRCGEFLFFEDGELTLGLPGCQKNIPSTPINDYYTVTVQDITEAPLAVEAYTRDSMKEDDGEIDDLNHTVIKKKSTGYPGDAFPEHTSSNAELANDEYIFPLYKDKFDKQIRESLYDHPLQKVLNALKALTEGTDFIASAVGFGVGETFCNIFSGTQATTVNTQQEQAHLLPYKKKMDDRYAEDRVVQYSTLNKEGWTTIRYYNDIRRHQEQQQRRIVCIDMGTNVTPVKLGQKISIAGLEDTYVIIQITQVSDQAWTHDFSQYDRTNSDLYFDRRSMKIYAIPAYQDDDQDKFIPPVQPVPIVRKTGPQTAFVTDNNDPKYQGRVRVAYPWQSLNSAEKAQLAEVEQKLELAIKEKEKLKADQESLPLLKVRLQDRMKELKDYVNASHEERMVMLEKKTARLSELQKSYEDLQKDRDKMYAEWHEKNAEIERLKKDSNYAKSEDGKNHIFDLETKRDALAAEIEKTDPQIAEKKKQIDELTQDIVEMKDAAEEHDKKKGSETYQDLETDNTVIARKRQACDRVAADIATLSGRKESVEREINYGKAQAEQIKKYIEEEIKDMATPWIRVTTPMATTGGGTYFRPQKGDEVLINFDNDNVERPYVVGSLFSKNVLDPYEGFERKGAPAMQYGTGKQVTMAIMSPNGHHITFSDPDKGDKFIYGLNPGTQFWGPIVAPMLGGADFKMLKNDRDLAGGIHIGDRYGIYEIEASTHDRYIKVKSPLGTVDISAFTGITIDAPNGDIKIRGKNVDIEAFNNLNITSGTNIVPPGIGKPDFTLGSPFWKTYKYIWLYPLSVLRFLGKGALWVLTFLGHNIMAAAPTAVNNILGPAQFADLSLFRHMLEVYLKPVEGTMLIKSKRYLKLEAGQGSATIDHDKFPQRDRINSLELFYIQLIEGVRDLLNHIDDFFTQFDSLWEVAYDNNIMYQKRGKLFLKRDEFGNKNDPDILSIAYQMGAKPWGEEIISAADYTSNMVTYIVFTDGNHYEDVPAKHAAFKEYALNFARGVHSVNKHVRDLPLLLDDYDANDSFQNAAKETIAHLAGIIVNKWKKEYGDTAPSPRFMRSKDNILKDAALRQQFKRLAAAVYLKKVEGSTVNNEGKFLTIGYELEHWKAFEQGKTLTDYNWKNYITHFDRVGTKANKLGIYVMDGIWEPIKKRWKKPWAAVDENKIWENQNGQILFSDNDGATLHFNGAKVESETQSNLGNREQLLKLLLSI